MKNIIKFLKEGGTITFTNTEFHEDGSKTSNSHSDMTTILVKKGVVSIHYRVPDKDMRDPVELFKDLDVGLPEMQEQMANSGMSKLNEFFTGKPGTEMNTL